MSEDFQAGGGGVLQVDCPPANGHLQKPQESTLVNVMRANNEGDDGCAVQIKQRTQVAFNFYGVNGASISCGQTLDFMRPQLRVKRVFLEDEPDFAHFRMLVPCPGLQSVERQGTHSPNARTP